jgi:predicted transcriptional regulator
MAHDASIRFRLPKDLRLRLERAARDTYKTPTEAAREAIKDYVDNHESDRRRKNLKAA